MRPYVLFTSACLLTPETKVQINDLLTVSVVEADLRPVALCLLLIDSCMIWAFAIADAI